MKPPPIPKLQLFLDNKDVELKTYSHYPIWHKQITLPGQPSPLNSAKSLGQTGIVEQGRGDDDEGWKGVTVTSVD